MFNNATLVKTSAQHMDVIILGAGLAGLTTALHLAPFRKVIVLAKSDASETATAWAQGGIVGVLHKSDSTESHLRDTMAAGAGIVDESVARLMSEHSCAAIQWLIQQGVQFTQDKDGPLGLHLTREGGHTHRRIFHAVDATGQAIHRELLNHAKAHPNIQIMEHYVAIDMILGRNVLSRTIPKNEEKGSQDRCFGIYALSQEHHEVMAILAPDVVIATGGAGQVYLHTTNPTSSTGDGIAMAWRAGCRVANMEFIQFHPTAFYQPKMRGLLITEALRGEGAYLRLPNGDRLMSQYDERLELAPRDIVARAITAEMKKHHLDYVLLDATHLGEQWLKEHFPTTYQRCLEEGVDISNSMIPVVPAAHYTCGGVVVDRSGQTDLPHLYAIGESAYTGFHGANRLASNSLLECVVMGQQVAQHILDHPSARIIDQVKPWSEVSVEVRDDSAKMEPLRKRLSQLMWNDVGIVRNQQGLEHALKELRNIQELFNGQYSHHKLSKGWIELRNLSLCAELIVLCARLRRESRGAHYHLDYPHSHVQASPTILTP
jgi:L-aspartate oxidase